MDELRTDGAGLVAFAEYLEKMKHAGIMSVNRHEPGDGAIDVLVAPEGIKLHSLKALRDEYKDKPDRREGTAQLQDLASLIQHVNRHKDGDSVLYADILTTAPSLTAVLDYQQAGADMVDTARFGKHRAHYAFPLSEEWKAWFAGNGPKNAMKQSEFAAFLEDRIADVANPPDWVQSPVQEERAAGGDFGERTPQEELIHLAGLLNTSFAGPARLMDLARGIKIHAEEQVQHQQVLTSGETALVYKSEHKDEHGSPLKVPGLFLIAIPIFRLGVRYQLAVRLRYRLAQGQVFWFYELYRHEVAFDHAVREACEKARNDTALPLFYGKPEGERLS